jgi:uncharacterized membrane protein
MNTTTHAAVAEYVARVKAELADLPAAEIEEILEDIEQHLGEVATELGDDVSVDTLVERLGTPEQYATELRTAAGYPAGEPAGPPPKQRRILPRFALLALVLGVAIAFAGGLAYLNDGDRVLGPVILFLVPLYAAVALIFMGYVKPSAVADLPEYRAFARAGRRAVGALSERTVTYLLSLRPAWWLIRIVVLVAGALLALDRKLGGSFVLVLAALLLVAWFGTRARDDKRWRWVVAPANFFTVGLFIALIASAWANLANREYRPAGYQVYEDGMVNDGRYIQNIYIFGPDGKPLPEAYLYDDRGQPLSLPYQGCPINRFEDRNKFPLPRIEISNDGSECREVTSVPFTVAIPTSPSPAPTPSNPTPTPTPSK